MKRIWKYLFTLFGCFILSGIIIFSVPSLRLRAEWQMAKLQASIKYSLNPPEKSVFVPEVNIAYSETEMANLLLTSDAQITATATALPIETQTPAPTLQPSPTPTPLPQNIALKGVRYEDQHGKWSYCAPANLSMLLSYWGWEGNREITGPYLKPYDRDKNVMPYEMETFISEQTNLSAIVRHNGNLQRLKAFLAAGFPVLVERGVYERDFNGVITWMGHYQVITGYDELTNVFIAQDSYRTPDLKVDADEFYNGWRSFNFVYLVAYPPERENEILAILGDDADELLNYYATLRRADEDIINQVEMDKYFAYFNRGSMLVKLQDYGGAAQAYDQAFALYGSLPEKTRPWRMMWYQTGPYFAYFYSGRYQDVINLATNTLEIMSEPILEETYYWRAQAKWALGDSYGAIEDFKTSLEYHANFPPTIQAAAIYGISLE
jgi:tetratricopeptide (TPR) repeat protein